jgi:hypothetical protein
MSSFDLVTQLRAAGDPLLLTAAEKALVPLVRYRRASVGARRPVRGDRPFELRDDLQHEAGGCRDLKRPVVLSTGADSRHRLSKQTRQILRSPTGIRAPTVAGYGRRRPARSCHRLG